jgi:hypothetical protein
MANFGDGDLGTFFEEMSCVVVWPDAQIQGKGIRDEGTVSYDFSSQRSEVIVGEQSLLVLTSMFPGLKKNDEIVVAGETVRVSRIEREADGGTSRAFFRSME